MGPKGKRRVLSFFDEGSTVSLINKELADSLGLVSHRTSLSLTGLNNTTLAVNIGGKTNFSIKSIQNDQFYVVKSAYVVSQLHLRA